MVRAKGGELETSKQCERSKGWCMAGAADDTYGAMLSQVSDSMNTFSASHVEATCIAASCCKPTRWHGDWIVIHSHMALPPITPRQLSPMQKEENRKKWAHRWSQSCQSPWRSRTRPRGSSRP